MLPKVPTKVKSAGARDGGGTSAADEKAATKKAEEADYKKIDNEQAQTVKIRLCGPIPVSEFRRSAFCSEQDTNVMCDAAVLVGGDDLDPDGLVWLREHGGVVLVGFAVECNAEEGEVPADLLAYDSGVLTNTPSEDERVEAAENGSVAGDGLCDRTAKDGDGLTCVVGALFCGGGKLAQIRYAGHQSAT